MVRIQKVTGRRLLREFIEYPYRKYRGHPHWVPPLRRDERQQFNPAKNPFYEHARMELFLASRDGRTTGRIAAIDDQLHRETHLENVAFFGFFEADDRDAASALLERAEATAHAAGRSILRGPFNPSLNENAGLQIDAFDTDPWILMPYNPPEYPRYLEDAGYRKAKDLYAWLIDLQQGVSRRFQRVAERAGRQEGIVVRHADFGSLGEEVQKIKAIYEECWKDNWGFVAPTEHEFSHMTAKLRQIMDPEIVLFVEVDGATAGFALSLPNFNQVLKQLNGRILPFGIFKLLRARKRIDQGRLALLGVLPEYRWRGLYPLLIYESIQRGRQRGIVLAECSWTLEDNAEVNVGIRAAGGTHYKTYRIYEKDLA